MYVNLQNLKEIVVSYHSLPFNKSNVGWDVFSAFEVKATKIQFNASNPVMHVMFNFFVLWSTHPSDNIFIQLFCIKLISLEIRGTTLTKTQYLMPSYDLQINMQ